MQLRSTVPRQPRAHGDAPNRAPQLHGDLPDRGGEVPRDLRRVVDLALNGDLGNRHRRQTQPVDDVGARRGCWCCLHDPRLAMSQSAQAPGAPSAQLAPVSVLRSQDPVRGRLLGRCPRGHRAAEHQRRLQRGAETTAGGHAEARRRVPARGRWIGVGVVASNAGPPRGGAREKAADPATSIHVLWNRPRRLMRVEPLCPRRVRTAPGDRSGSWADRLERLDGAVVVER